MSINGVIDMELWLDTTDIELIKSANKLGILKGITTNPTILSKANALPEEIIQRTLKEVPNCFFAVQVTKDTTSDMIEQAWRLFDLHQNIIIKIPVTRNGLCAINSLAREKIPCMATAIFEPNQLLLAAMAGAEYAAPYLSHIENVKPGNGMEVIQDMVQIVSKQQYSIKLIAASINSVDQIMQCAGLGVPAITLPGDVYLSFIATNSRTQESMDKFERAWSQGQHTGLSEIF
jgi:TalC/MipB family fructose-6-phosphate aldolase